jgi:DNA-binding MarR family transcriptional regulator
MIKLTESQKEIVDFVQNYKTSFSSSGQSVPTYDEIARGVGVAVRAVQYQLDKLEKLGVVKRERNKNGRCIPRTLVIVQLSEDALEYLEAILNDPIELPEVFELIPSTAENEFALRELLDAGRLIQVSDACVESSTYRRFKLG